MFNLIKNNITIRKGFIIGVICLVLFNLLLIGGYYMIHLNNEANDHHTKVRTELKKEITYIKEELLSPPEEIYNDEEKLDKSLSSYAKKENIKIELSNKDNEIIKAYSYKESKKPGSYIIVSEIIEYKDTTYLLTISQKQDIIGANIVIDFLAFEFIIIALLGMTGILGANSKILDPLTQLSKDFSNYKLGILPKKRKVRSGIDSIQNDFVNLVSELEEEKAKQNRIIASISHDIKTPLTSILGYSELLLNNENLPAKTKQKYASTIHNKSLVMKEIVEEFDDYLSCNLKDTSKIEKISISHLVDYLNDYYKEDLKEKNIEFKVRTNCPNQIIKVDLPKFKRIFSNTITNSIRHYNSDKKMLIININEQKFDKIKFEIADNGTGCKEDLQKIFEPLYTTDKSRKISGLGLSICKEIVESHKGTIKAENNKLGGFSIIFTIDAYKED